MIWLRRFRLAFLQSRRKVFWSPTCLHVLVLSFPASFSSPSPFLTLLLLNWNATVLPRGFPATIPGHLALCSSELVPSFPSLFCSPSSQTFWHGREEIPRPEVPFLYIPNIPLSCMNRFHTFTKGVHFQKGPMVSILGLGGGECGLASRTCSPCCTDFAELNVIWRCRKPWEGEYLKNKYEYSLISSFCRLESRCGSR